MLLWEKGIGKPNIKEVLWPAFWRGLGFEGCGFTVSVTVAVCAFIGINSEQQLVDRHLAQMKAFLERYKPTLVSHPAAIDGCTNV